MARFRLTPSIVVALVALLFAASAGGYAATQSGSIQACVRKIDGSLYVGKCAKHDRKLSWSKTGPQGQPGPKGDPGPAGPTGPAGSARGWADVNSDGSVSTHGGAIAINVVHLATGQYCLQFSPSVGTFAPIVATLHGDDTVGFISVNDEFGNNCNPDGGIELTTENSSGVAADEDFAVAVP